MSFEKHWTSWIESSARFSAALKRCGHTNGKHLLWLYSCLVWVFTNSLLEAFLEQCFGLYATETLFLKVLNNMCYRWLNFRGFQNQAHNIFIDLFCEQYVHVYVHIYISFSLSLSLSPFSYITTGQIFIHISVYVHWYKYVHMYVLYEYTSTCI